MKRALKILTVTACAIATIVLVVTAVVLLRWDRTFDAPYPDIHASKDPKVIERGRYIAFGPGHCAGCHTDQSLEPALNAGQMPPMSGGRRFRLPFGTLYTPNLTPDRETGIGRRKDGEIARILRYGVRADGRAAMPFMEFHHMSDDDLQAVISYLRSQPAVRKEVAPHQLTFLGKTIAAFILKPVGPKSTPSKTAPAEEATVERGEYIANSLAGCAGCHTKRNPLDGSYQAARFSGGMEMPIDAKRMLVTPNLTPDPKTGRIASWPEEQFVGRFGAGVGVEGTHMPWKMYQRMSKTDLQAIYRYLRSLEPVQNATGPSIQERSKG
ncbi:MAG TPA: c-type cytochrome [Thermoanaerobaculia bacterium]|nr:c-type cytochrome [Thermoanaerobaculia bacterium]